MHVHNIHICTEVQSKHLYVGMGVCLRVLYAIIPAFIAYCHAYTPRLNPFWLSDPYIFLGNVRLSCYI